MCVTHMGPSSSTLSGRELQRGQGEASLVEAPQKIRRVSLEMRRLHETTSHQLVPRSVTTSPLPRCSRAPRRGFIINLRRCPSSICMEQGRNDGYTLPCRQSRYGVDDGELAGKVDNRRRKRIRWISDERPLTGPGPFRLQSLFACRESCGLTGGRMVSLIH